MQLARLGRRGPGGTVRTQGPPNVRIRLMCSGAADPAHVLKALLDGADGVLIGGCHPGNPHYQEANDLAQRRVTAPKEILKGARVDKDRVWLGWVAGRELEIGKRAKR